MTVGATVGHARTGPAPRRIGAAVLAIAIAVAACAWAAPAPPVPEIRIGVLAPEGVSDVLHTWDFVQPALERALPGYRVRLELLDVAALRGIVDRSQADFFIANSGFFVEMEARYGAAALATVDAPKAVSPQQALSSALVVRADRGDLASLSAVDGKRVVAVSEELFGGYQIAMYALREAGVTRGDLAAMRFVGYDANAMLADLMADRADVAIMRRCLFEQLTRSPRFPRAAFRVINEQAADHSGCARSTPLYPDWTLARLKHTNHDLARRVTLALLAMPPTREGYAWTVPMDYGSVHEVLRGLEIGPYEYLSRRTVGGLYQRYRFAFAMFGLGLLAVLFHVVNSERLVQRRTADLRRALAERDRISAEVRAREEQLVHLSRLGILGEMSSMLAHELNQPLSAIASFAQGIVRRIDAGLHDPAPLAEAGDEIARQAERAGAIVRRVRMFSRKRPEERVQVDLCEVIEASIDLFHGLAPGAPAIAVTSDANCGDGAQVSIDRLPIEQVLLNLLKNALDATQSLPPEARRISVHLACDDGQFRVAVRDNGEGLPDGALHRLFEPFYTSKPSGLGLGLAICRRVIEAHGGRIEAARNTGGRGMTVSFTLARLATDAARATSAEAEAG